MPRPAEPASRVTSEQQVPAKRLAAADAAGAVEQPTPAPPPSARRHRPWRLRLAVAALTVLVLGVGAVALSRSTMDLFGLAARAQATDPAAPGDEIPAPVSYLDPQHGYTVEVPATWRASCPYRQICRFSAPASDPRVSPEDDVFLQLVAEPAGGRTSLDLARAYDQQLATDGDHPGYRRIELGWAFLGQYRGAVLEFTYRGRMSGSGMP